MPVLLYRLYTILVWFQCFTIDIALSPRVVKIGLMYSDSGTLRFYGQTAPIVAEMWRNWSFIQSNGLGGLDIYPELYLYDVASDPSQTLIGIQDLIRQNVSVISAPEENLLGVVAAFCSITVPTLPVVSSMSFSDRLSLNASGIYPSLFGILGPSDQYFTGVYPLIRRFYTRVSFIYLETSLDTSVCTGSLEDAAMQGLSVLSLHSVNSSADVSLSLAVILDHVANVEDPDVIFFCGYDICNDFLLQLKYSGWIPSVIVTFDCANRIPEILNTEDLDLIDAYRYIISSRNWDSRLMGRKYTDSKSPVTSNMFPVSAGTGYSPMIFKEAYELVASGIPMNAFTASQLAGLYAIAGAVIGCNCTTSAGIAEAMSRMGLTSFYGAINFDTSGQNSLNDVVYVQLDLSLDPQLLYPLTPETINPIWPIPTYQERIYNDAILGKDSEMAILGLAILGAIVCLTLVVLVIRWRHHPEIRATSPWFSSLFLLGCSIGCLWVSTWLLNTTQQLCHFRNVGLAFGVGLMLSSILAKTWRIARIFGTEKLRVQKITDRQVATSMLISLIPLLVTTFLGEILQPTQCVRIIVDPIRPIRDYTSCVYNVGGWLVASGIWLYLILILCLYYAWKVRKAYVEINEAWSITKIIGLVTLGFVFNTLLFFLSNPMDRELIFISRSVCNLVVFVGSALVLVRQPIMKLRFGGYKESSVVPEGNLSPKASRTVSPSLKGPGAKRHLAPVSRNSSSRSPILSLRSPVLLNRSSQPGDPTVGSAELSPVPESELANTTGKTASKLERPADFGNNEEHSGSGSSQTRDSVSITNSKMLEVPHDVVQNKTGHLYAKLIQNKM
jgi:hypothetical protein